MLSKFADYSGDDKPNVDKLTFRIYQDAAAAYADAVAGSLDYIDDSNIPSDQSHRRRVQDRLPGPQLSSARPADHGWITFSPNDPQLKDNVELRKAISRAIDRDLINKQIFNGTRPPATAGSSPVVDGYKAGACGDSCTFDAAAAKAAYEAAGGYKGTLTMTYNADSPNKAWSEAICNSIKNALGLDCTAVPTVDFATFNKKIDAQRAQGHLPHRLADGLPVDRELPDSDLRQGRRLQLAPSTTTRSSTQADRGRRGEDARRGQRAVPAGRGMLAKDFPTAPLWYHQDHVGLVGQGHRREGQRRSVSSTSSAIKVK